MYTYASWMRTKKFWTLIVDPLHLMDIQTINWLFKAMHAAFRRIAPFITRKSQLWTPFQE